MAEDQDGQNTGPTEDANDPSKTDGIKENAAAIVDKTVEQIKSDAGMLAGDVKKEVAVVARHPAHDVLDEFEQHLSQFAFETHAVYHGFLSRLRSMF